MPVAPARFSPRGVAVRGHGRFERRCIRAGRSASPVSDV